MLNPYLGRPASDFNFQHIRYEKSGYRATVTFNRPDKLNAVIYPMLPELGEAFPGQLRVIEGGKELRRQAA